MDFGGEIVAYWRPHFRHKYRLSTVDCPRIDLYEDGAAYGQIFYPLYG
jgi:hypothetical protein